MRTLIVGHAEDGDDGHIGRALRDRGAVVSTWWRDESSSPPATDDVDIVVALGSSWRVADPIVAEPVEREQRWLAELHAARVPVLGICFGAQQLAAALGGAVVAADPPEIGWYDLETDVEALMGPWFEWHFDTTEPPDRGVELASNAAGVQAWELGSVVAVQFHPEVTPAIIDRWLSDPCDASGMSGDEQCRRVGTNRTAIENQTTKYEADAARRADNLIEWFLARS